MRIGMLTGGGDCPGLNAVIRAAVRKGILHHGDEFIGFMEGWRGVIENVTMPLTLETTSGILQKGGTILRSSRTNVKKVEGGFEKCLETIKKNNLDALIALGGDDTQSITLALGERGVKCVGVPKTIDNDLSGTDACFGFDTAVMIATEAVDRLHSTAEAHQRVMVVQLMGRHTGWIALESGLAGGADVILIPEIPYSIEAITEKLIERERTGRRFSIVVVAEGARPAGGEPSYIEGSHRYGGIAERIAHEIEERCGKETRTLVLGHIQRGGSPNPYDRNLALRFGAAAVRCVERGNYGSMVALQGKEIRAVPIGDAVQEVKRVQVNSELVNTARRLGISFGD